MTVKELKEVIESLPDNMKVVIAKDEEWNGVRECGGYNFTDYVWCKGERDILEVEDIYPEEVQEFESCIVLC